MFIKFPLAPCFSYNDITGIFHCSRCNTTTYICKNNKSMNEITEKEKEEMIQSVINDLQKHNKCIGH